MIIAIDGPAGAGKSTVAKVVAKKLNYLYLDTGAMYRALTLKVLRKGISTDDTQAVVNLASCSAIDLINNSDGSLTVILDAEDVNSYT